MGGFKLTGIMLPRRRPKPPQDADATGPKIVAPGSSGSPPENVKEMRVMRSYIEYDPGVEDSDRPGRANWTMIWGIVVVAAISAGFWAGVWLLAKHYWK